MGQVGKIWGSHFNFPEPPSSTVCQVFCEASGGWWCPGMGTRTRGHGDRSELLGLGTEVMQVGHLGS